MGEGARTALDLFAGTSRVGHALKRAGVRVLGLLTKAHLKPSKSTWRQMPAKRVQMDPSSHSA